MASSWSLEGYPTPERINSWHFSILFQIGTWIRNTHFMPYDFPFVCGHVAYCTDSNNTTDYLTYISIWTRADFQIEEE
jgi:hypothetical protein